MDPPLSWWVETYGKIVTCAPSHLVIPVRSGSSLGTKRRSGWTKIYVSFDDMAEPEND